MKKDEKNSKVKEKTKKSVSKKKKKKNKKHILITLIIVILILLGGYHILTSNPKYVFGKTIKSIEQSVKEYANKTKNIDTSKGTVELNYKISSTDETVKALFEALNGITLKMNYQIDLNKNLKNIDIASKYNDNELLNLNVYEEKNNVYILLPDIYDKYLSLDLDDSTTKSVYSKKSIDDITTLTESFKDSLSKTIKKEDLTKEKTTISLNSKDIKVTKNSLIINKTNRSRILSDFLINLKNDTEFIKTLAKISNEQEQDLKNDINNLIDEIKKASEENDTDIMLSIYTKGFFKKIVRYELSLNGKEIKIALTNNNGNYDISSLQNENEIVTGTISEKSKKSSKKSSYNYDIKLNINNLLNMTLNLKINEQYKAVVKEIDVSENKDINKLSEDEKNDIMDKLMENEGFANLVIAFKSIFGA